MTATIAGIADSLRRGSGNGLLLQAAGQELLPGAAGGLRAAGPGAAVQRGLGGRSRAAGSCRAAPAYCRSRQQPAAAKQPDQHHRTQHPTPRRTS
jgi:hypothetical protein